MENIHNDEYDGKWNYTSMRYQHTQTDEMNT